MVGESLVTGSVSKRSVNGCVDNGGNIVNNSPNFGAEKVNGGIQRRHRRLLPGIQRRKLLIDKPLRRKPTVIHA
jgi:hypothetical protein